MLFCAEELDRPRLPSSAQGATVTLRLLRSYIVLEGSFLRQHLKTMAPETEENKLCPARTSFPPAVWSLPIASANDLCLQGGPSFLSPLELHCDTFSVRVPAALSAWHGPLAFLPQLTLSMPVCVSELHPAKLLLAPACGEGRCQVQGSWQVNSTISGSQTSSPSRINCPSGKSELGAAWEGTGDV